LLAWGLNRLDMFAVGMDFALQHRAYDGSWHDVVSLGGVVLS